MRGDHPRSRGEYRAVADAVDYIVGSSPLSRGIRYPFSRVAVLERIIPALAGNTIREPPAQEYTLDHPRSRGEYGLRMTAYDLISGSSPLSRGILTGRARRSGVARIIPALAGNTGSRCYPEKPRRDHPRSRGEYLTYCWLRNVHAGSSPLSRGIRHGVREQHLGAGIIPALAGNTASGRDSRCAWADHPRSRGEYPGVRESNASPNGSSPLSRGILARAIERCLIAGIIPALAGNTPSSSPRLSG